MMGSGKKSSQKRKKKPKDIIIDSEEVRVKSEEVPTEEGKGRQRDAKGRFVKGHKMEEGAGFEPGNLEASKYLPKYCADMLRFFDDVYAEGNYPTFEMFAATIDVTARTLENWVGVYPEFSDAYTACKNKQRGALLEGAMAGRFNATFAKFVAVNCHGMKEKVEVEDKHSGGFKISVDYFEGEEE